MGHCRVTALPRLNSCSASNSPAARPVILCLGRFKIRLEQIWAIMLHKLMHMEQARACGDRLNRHRLVPQRKIHTPRPNSPMANYVAITARPFLHRCAITCLAPTHRSPLAVLDGCTTAKLVFSTDIRSEQSEEFGRLAKYLRFSTERLGSGSMLVNVQFRDH